LIDRRARLVFKTCGPWIAIATTLIVAAPHVVWLIQHDFIPYTYVDKMSAPVTGVADHIFHPLQFLLTVMAILAPCLLIASPLILARSENSEDRIDLFDRRVISVLAFGPGITLVAISLISGRGLHSSWAWPLGIYTGLWIVIVSNLPARESVVRHVLLLWILVFCGLLSAFVFNLTILPGFDHRYRSAFFPGQSIAQELSARFRTITGQPLAYVIGPTWVGGNIAHYASEEPELLIDGSAERAPWIDFDDMKHRGALVVWAGVSGLRGAPSWSTEEMGRVPSYYGPDAQRAQVQVPLQFRFSRGVGLITIGWAIVPPVPKAVR
jgi:hypothetical protein